VVWLGGARTHLQVPKRKGRKRRIAEFGDTVFASSPEEFGKHIVEFTDKWSKVIRAANIKQPGLPIIGLIDVGGNAGPTIAAFQKGLAEAGYVEGQNLTIDGCGFAADFD